MPIERYNKHMWQDIKLKTLQMNYCWCFCFLHLKQWRAQNRDRLLLLDVYFGPLITNIRSEIAYQYFTFVKTLEVQILLLFFFLFHPIKLCAQLRSPFILVLR